MAAKAKQKAYRVNVTATLHGTAVVRAESEEAAIKQVEDLGVPDMEDFLQSVQSESYDVDGINEDPSEAA